MVQITIEVEEKTIQSYLDHYGECVGREIKWEDLSPELKNGVLESLGGEMSGELLMRTDDHSGFETENYLYPIFGD